MLLVTLRSLSLLTGQSPVARLAQTAAGGAGQNRNAIILAGGAAARVELQQVLLPGPLEVREPGPGLVF